MRTSRRDKIDADLPRAAVDVGHHREALAGAAAEQRDVREANAEHFRKHPGADREIAAAHAKHERRRHHRSDRRRQPAERDREKGVQAHVLREDEDEIAADADEGLDADRHHAPVSSHEVPHLRQQKIADDLDGPTHQGWAAPQGNAEHR